MISISTAGRNLSPPSGDRQRRRAQERRPRKVLRVATAGVAALALIGCDPSIDPSQGKTLLAAQTRTSGLEADLLASALADARALPRLNSIIVARNGRVVAERSLDGRGLDQPVNIKSASKSVLSALVGAAVARGELSLDQRVLPLLAGRLPADPDPRLNALTIEHLLSMRAGLQSTSGANYGAWAASRDWVRAALAQPMVDEPGGGMIYSTGTTHILSAALSRATGRSTLDLARDWLGEPLDITIPAWPRDPQGTYFGGNDMRLSPRALLRFGELYRNDGVVGARRVLPEGWVKASWTRRGTSRWGGDYGYGWWLDEARGHPIYFAWGYGGQMVYVVPDLALTVVMTSDADVSRERGHIDALHRIVAERLIPAAEAGGSASVAA